LYTDNGGKTRVLGKRSAWLTRYALMLHCKEIQTLSHNKQGGLDDDATHARGP